jgi:hypothetical protein
MRSGYLQVGLFLSAHHGAHKEASQVVYMKEICAEGYPIPALNRPNRVFHRNSTVSDPDTKRLLECEDRNARRPIVYCSDSVPYVKRDNSPLSSNTYEPNMIHVPYLCDDPCSKQKRAVKPSI